jgi:hypothetical protein
MAEVEISITLKKNQIVNDVLTQCNVLGRTLKANVNDANESGQKSSNSDSELATNIMAPDDETVKPVVARSITEGFAQVKLVCGKYLILGRETDDNRLEKIATKDSQSKITYGELQLKLSMPSSFNKGVTETVKSAAHKAIVDYVMRNVLMNQLVDKSKEYDAYFVQDLDDLRQALRARITSMSRRQSDWT